MPNHFHLLLRTGRVSIAQVMRRLLTGYAITYNRRHRRTGHLFQDRYRSVLCDEEPYLLELVRYIHLNPFRAGLVAEMEALDRCRYCGHSAITGKQTNDWQGTEAVLRRFSDKRSTAQQRYRRFVEKGFNQGTQDDLTGGGLSDSQCRWMVCRSGNAAPPRRPEVR
jgi:putative transposase